ncbi:MAG: hypothetical protein QW837_06060 [Conexivisphaerales archaeon]
MPAECYVPPRETMELRELVRYWARVAKVRALIDGEQQHTRLPAGVQCEDKWTLTSLLRISLED